MKQSNEPSKLELAESTSGSISERIDTIAAQITQFPYQFHPTQKHQQKPRPPPLQQEPERKG